MREEGEGGPGWRKQPSVELVERRERGVASGLREVEEEGAEKVNRN